MIIEGNIFLRRLRLSVPSPQGRRRRSFDRDPDAFLVNNDHRPSKPEIFTFSSKFGVMLWKLPKSWVS